ncbi:ion transporter [Rubrivirga sp.]|uniref:ion transporter n=1 Tax=Rubrivirga sp. TaxID=1885344 RepID=UPI003B51D930
MPDATPALNPDRPTPEGFRPAGTGLRRRLFGVVFHADDPAGKAFDVVLIVAILASVVVVMVESVASVQDEYADELLAVEWFFTALFTVEYALRLWVVQTPGRYARSFFGVVDLLAILPTYLSLMIPGAQVLLTVRILRALRVFRVLKLANYLDEADQLRRALAASRRKILVFIFVVLTIVTVMGSMMYLIEGGENGFTSIPQSVYWAVVTLSTVGFGDIYPVTPLGKALATVIIIMGYGIIAVPTGIVTVELGREREAARAGTAKGTLGDPAMVQLDQCPRCGLGGHDADASFCKRCGGSVVVKARPVSDPVGTATTANGAP